MNSRRMENEKLVENEIKIAFVRIITILFGLFLIFFFYPEGNRLKYLIILSIITAYGIVVFPVIKIYRNKIGLISKIITLLDVSVISLGICMTDLDSYI